MTTHEREFHNDNLRGAGTAHRLHARPDWSRFISRILLASSAALLIPVAHASDAPGEQGADASQSAEAVPEIIVSARRRDEVLTNVPASVTAYSSDFIQK